MIGSELNLDVHVRTRRDDWNFDASCIIPRLPNAQPLSGNWRTGAAIRLWGVQMTVIVVAVRAAIWAIPELLRHAIYPIFKTSHSRDQLDLANRVDQPSMASDMRGGKCKCEGLQHVMMKDRIQATI